jgi:hypothetical protein
MQGLPSTSVTMPFALVEWPEKAAELRCRRPISSFASSLPKTWAALDVVACSEEGKECLKALQERLAGRRKLIKFTGASLLLTVSPLSPAAPNRNPGVLAVRIWPAADYTRVAIEHAAPLKYTHFIWSRTRSAWWSTSRASS